MTISFALTIVESKYRGSTPSPNSKFQNPQEYSKDVTALGKRLRGKWNIHAAGADANLPCYTYTYYRTLLL